MCIICKDWELEKLTAEEAMRNIGEALLNSNREHSKHLLDLSDKILNKEVPMKENDSDMDEKWWNETYDSREE